jgi:hypothetical protein
VRQHQEHVLDLEPDHHRIIGTVKKVHRHFGLQVAFQGRPPRL